ncbi:MAG: glutamate--tRNA ligase [Phycisphaeraceae bacterium]|nr:glutamate--tRNA ligase [Phycisphaeraceae bacterium]
MTNPPVITRFAPSPTGHLHIGGARTALFCWAFARRHGGHFVLRIEDTDAARSSDESARGIMEDLVWLGIEWDEGPEFTTPDGRKIGGDPRGVGPFFQARRVDLYNSHLERLVRAGLAYPAFEGSEELEARRKAVFAAKGTYRYERPADVTPGVFNEARWARALAGETHVVRLVSPMTAVVVDDQVLGEKTFPADHVDDFVIRKADGLPTYHFAVVVDDETMGITHVLRAQEHFNNTPRHIVLQRALGFRTPVYGHMPLIFNMDGTKMGKRDKAKAARAAAKTLLQKSPDLNAELLAAGIGQEPAVVEQFLAAENDSMEVAAAIAAKLGIALPEVEVSDFRANGYLPGAIDNFVSLLGWNPGMKAADGKDLEKFDTAFLAGHFDMARIGRTNAKFDRAKLLSFDGDAIAAMSDEEFARAWRAWCSEYEPALPAGLDGPRWTLLARAVKPRAKTMRDGVKAAGFAMLTDAGVTYDPAAVEKNLRAKDGEGLGLLREFHGALQQARDWEPQALNAMVEAFAKERGVGMGAIAQPIRVALAGTGVSPPLGETMGVLGRESTLARISRCLAVHAA